VLKGSDTVIAAPDGRAIIDAQCTADPCHGRLRRRVERMCWGCLPGHGSVPRRGGCRLAARRRRRGIWPGLIADDLPDLLPVVLRPPVGVQTMKAMVLNRLRTRSRGRSCRTHNQRRTKSASKSWRAAYAARICMSSMANCRTPTCRSFRVMRSWVGSMRFGKSVQGLRSVSASASRGWATRWHLPLLPDASAKISAISRCHRLHPQRRLWTAAVADARFDFRREVGSDVALARYCVRAHRLALVGDRRGCPEDRLYGFGAAAHILTQVINGRGVRYMRSRVREIPRPQSFARGLGAAWAAADERPPEPLDAAIIFAPVLEHWFRQRYGRYARAVRVVCAGIHNERHSGLPLFHPVGERELLSVPNLTRKDGLDSCACAAVGST